MAPGASSGEFSIRFSTFQFQLWRSKEGGYHLDGKIRQRLRPSVGQRSHNLVPIDCSDRHNGHDKEISIGEGRCRGPLLAPQVARMPKSEIFRSNLLSMENMNLADVRLGERCFTRAIFVACKTATANAGSNQFRFDHKL